MSRYVISDHHFGHDNIIKYCDRPFSSAGEMNDVLLDRHFETVGADDVLIHVGDVAMDMKTGEQTIKYFLQLDGDVLLRGNHDAGLDAETAPFPVLTASIIKHGEYQFYCTHRPGDIPEWWDGWAIHSHHHNNHPEEYPLLRTDVKRINVSAELLNYRPVTVEDLVALVETTLPGLV